MEKYRPSVIEMMKANSVAKEPQNNINMSITEQDFTPNDNDTVSDNDDDFLGDLSNDKFVSQSVIEANEKEQKKLQKERDAEEARQARLERKQEAQAKKAEKLAEKHAKAGLKSAVLDETHSLFTDGEGTAILGKQRLELIAKINQYKLLFPENQQIKALKIKKNASVDELILYLAECDAYISTSTIDKFITDAILQTIKVGELVSCQTRFNLTGLSAMLKQNLQFNSLCRQLYLKYQVFSNIPPEHQLGLIIVTSAWVCIQANKQNSISSIHLEKQVDASLFN